MNTRPYKFSDSSKAAPHTSSDWVSQYLEKLLGAMNPGPEGPVPDWGTRLSGAKLALAYELGLPIARAEEKEKPQVDSGDIERRLLHCPGYRRSFRAYLDSCERIAADTESPGAPKQDTDQPKIPTEPEG